MFNVLEVDVVLVTILSHRSLEMFAKRLVIYMISRIMFIASFFREGSRRCLQVRVIEWHPFRMTSRRCSCLGFAN